ncbi:MAG TPA: hypothetical protein V6D17_00355 [Candidatus Obscuribacterales bacterium]
MSDSANNELEIQAAVYFQQMSKFNELRQEWMSEYGIDTGKEPELPEEHERVPEKVKILSRSRRRHMREKSDHGGWIA